MAGSKIRIAIIGGGIAGVTVANALLKHTHVDVQLYESSPQFSERGAGIGLSDLALSALDGIIPSAVNLLKTKAGAVAVGPARIVVGSGPGVGKIVSDIEEDSGLAMNRAPLLKALLEPLPADILHANKKLVSLKQSDTDIEIVFEDGSIAVFDAVIGADGLFSSVRQYVHQAEAGDYGASPAGWWDCRNLVPLEKAKALIGEESFKVDREFCWVGDRAFIMHAVVENRTMVQCIIAAVEEDFPSDRKRPITKETLENALKGWSNGPVAKGMIEIMLDQENPHAYSIWEHKDTPTYARGNVCLIGDAAHTTSPWQGAGAGLVVEDAFILGHLFGQVTSPQQIGAAFKAFDAVRRPRCQTVIDTSRRAGQLFCGQVNEIGLDPEKMAEEIGLLYTSLDSLELDMHRKAAAEHFQSFIKSDSH